MSMNMKRIVCYCLAISMIPLKECAYSDGDCMEPQLLVKETYCSYNNMTSLTMYPINNKSLATSLHDGCAVDFDEPLYLNKTFYFECDTETICSDESKEISRDNYYLECEEVEIFSERITESYLLRNETTTDFDDKSTVNSTNSNVFTFESSTTVEIISNNDISISSEANGITTESTTTGGGIFINYIANSSDTNMITTEAFTEVDGILNQDVTNSSQVYAFTTKTTTELSDKSKDSHNSTKADIFDTKTTTEYYDILKDMNATSATIDDLSNNTDAHLLKAATEDSPDFRNIFAILGYSLAGVGATLALAFGAYLRFKNAVQSGSYLIPETTGPQGFIELA